MANTKVTSAVIEAGAILNTHIASGAISSGHLSGINTGAVAEGSNLYYTDARARASISVTGGNLAYDSSTGVLQLTDNEIRDAISAGGNLSYNNSTGVMSYTTPTMYTDADAQGAITVTDAGGDGSLAYSGGTITYTGPSAAEVRAHLSAGNALSYSSGQFAVVAPTASGGTNTTALATTAFVQQELTTLIGGAPSTLNDLNELAAAINDDANYNTTLTTALATKAPLASPAFTGNGSIAGSFALNTAGSQLQIGPSNNMQIYHNGGAGEISSANNLTLDVAGDIILDADGGNVKIVDNGVVNLDIYKYNSNVYVDNPVADSDIIFQGLDGSTSVSALTLDMSDAGTAIFNNKVVVDTLELAPEGNNDRIKSTGGVLYLKANELSIQDNSGNQKVAIDTNILFDTAGIIVLDADNAGVIQLKDGGSHYGSFYTASDAFNIQSNINNADINFIGKDDNTNITALTLDMSESGDAYFNGDIRVLDNRMIRLGTGQEFRLYHDATNSHITSLTGQLFVGSTTSNTWIKGVEAGLTSADGSEYMVRGTTNGSLKIYHDNVIKLETTANGINVTGNGIFSGNGSFGGTLGVTGNLTAGALFSNAGLRNAGGSDFGSQQSFWAAASGTTHQAGYTIGWNTGGNSARTQKMVLDNNGNLLINNTLSVGIASTLKGYFYEDTFDQNGNAKPTSVVGVAAATNSVGEGPTIDFSSIWSQNTVYQQDNWNEGWTIGRIGAVYDNQVGNGGALVFYTHSGTTASGGAGNTEVSEKMRIRPNGNVGIGTSTPLSLDGNAAPGLTVSSNGPYILLQDANNSDKVRYISNNTGAFQFGIVGDNGISGKTEHMRIASDGKTTFSHNVKISGASSYSAANLAEANNENMALHISPVRASVATGISIGDFGSVSGIQAYNNSTNAALSFVLNPFGGNVGIGVTDPEKKLEVKSDTTYDGILIDVLSAPEIRLRDRGNSDTLIGTGRHQLDGFHIDTYSGNALFIEGSTREVGIGSTSPAAQLHVRKVAGLNTTVELLRLDCGDTTHVGGKAGKIVFTDISVYNSTAEITAARVGVSSASFLKFDLRGSEVMRMESGGDMIYGGATGVHEKYFSGNTTGNATFSHDITHTADNSQGTVLKIMAAFTHHPSYDCMLESWVSRRDAGFVQYEQFRRNTGTSGSWALSRVSATVTRVTKVAGTYAGGGPYWIKAVWRNN